MKFLIRPYSNPEWIENFLPGVNLLDLSICNKPLLDYYLDFLYLIGTSEVLIITPHYQENLMGFLGRESEWGIKIRIEIASNEESYDSIENRYSTFFEDSRYGVIEGPIFINFDQRNTDLLENLRHRKSIRFNSDSTGDFFVSELSSIGSYYNLCMELVGKKYENYSLPGFGVLNGGSIGKGVILKNLDSISRSVNIGNYVLVHKNSLVKSNSIIGSHVVIEGVAEIESSIVYDNTVVGEGVHIKNKIIYNGRVICPLVEEYVDVDKKLLLPLMDRTSYKDAAFRFSQVLISFIFICLSLPGWVFVKVFSFFSKEKVFLSESLRDRNGDEFSIQCLNTDLLKKRRFLFIVTKIFFVRYFPKFFQVLLGRINLIGADPGVKRRLGLRDKSSSIFYYSNLIKDPDLRPFHEVVDCFYLFRAKIILDIYALFKIIFSRIIYFIR